MIALTRPFAFRRFVSLASIFVAMICARCGAAFAGARAQEPTIVSIRFQDVPAAEAYAALAKQAGVTIRYGWGPPAGNHRVTATLIHEPFWSAIARIGKTAGMHPTYVRREPAREVWLSPQRVMSTHKPVGTSVDGLFIGTLYDNVDQLLVRAQVDVTRKHTSVLSIGVRAEPKIKPMMLHSIKIDELVDDTGRPLDAEVLYKALIFHDGFVTPYIRLPERPWPRSVGRIRLSGKVLASSKSELAELTDLTLDTPPGVSTAGFRIEAQTRQGARGRKITLCLTRDVEVTPDWLRPSSRLGLLEPIVLDPDGRKFLLHTIDRDWFGRMCRFQLEAEAPNVNKGEKPFGPPHRLLMEVPTEVFEYDVKFEFSDVKLF
jgi:hypothetical protein